LALLREWAPEARATLEAERRVAAAEGDGLAELSAVRRLRALAPEERGLRLREADLELEVGDVGRGLELLEELAAASPDDPELTERLGRARFRWRLELLPPSSRELTRRPELTRGDFAVLLYWLFPSVRYGRVVGGGTIANDVFDHPAREQIVKVVNLGLMQVDRTLHRFRPESPLSQGEALRSLLSLLLLQQPRLACAEGATAGELERSTTALCRVSAACGLLPGEGDCLPGATVSGPEAVEAARRTLEQLGAD
ncbi:MAG: hypothetical protein R3325_15400, partial [Thermoanaerobaculia bacterium]|nr:hypothetical protein [Thermoanaerobaculia bacterium]